MTKIQQEIRGLGNPASAEALKRFFKTGKGEYGEGDVFLGISVPRMREIAKKYKDLSVEQCVKLLTSKLHEERYVALFIFVARCQKAEKKEVAEICKAYLSHAKYVNNWDLVDASAADILGRYLEMYPVQKKILRQLALSSSLWEKRISMVATYWFIRQGQLAEAMGIAKILLKDPHDLIQKAVGWMLREAGKKDEALLEGFLQKEYARLARTTLRYAIERFPEQKRKAYLAGMF